MQSPRFPPPPPTVCMVSVPPPPISKDVLEASTQGSGKKSSSARRRKQSLLGAVASSSEVRRPLVLLPLSPFFSAHSALKYAPFPFLPTHPQDQPHKRSRQTPVPYGMGTGEEPRVPVPAPPASSSSGHASAAAGGMVMAGAPAGYAAPAGNHPSTVMPLPPLFMMPTSGTGSGAASMCSSPTLPLGFFSMPRSSASAADGWPRPHLDSLLAAAVGKSHS